MIFTHFYDATAAPVSCQKCRRQFLPVVLQRLCGQWTNVCGESESLVHRLVQLESKEEEGCAE